VQLTALFIWECASQAHSSTLASKRDFYEAK